MEIRLELVRQKTSAKVFEKVLPFVHDGGSMGTRTTQQTPNISTLNSYSDCAVSLVLNLLET